MAKKRPRANKAAAAARRVTSTPPPPSTPAARSATPPALAPAAAPVFWFGFEVSWAKLALARVVIFGLLAVDALLQIRHAPRYGAGGFNVAHLPGLDALGPERASYAIGQLVVAYLLVLAACGVATRIVVPIATTLYAWLYFGSQLDSYQHHYLVALVLLVACFVPWQRPPDAEPATRIRSWALRLLLVQLAIVYLWAAISKLDAAWLDGRTLASQLSGSLRETIEDGLGFSSTARFTVLIELALAVTVWIRPAWIVALPLGVAFHLGILASGLEIGLFAYLMLAFYLLLVPDRVLAWIAETRPVRALGAVVRAVRVETGSRTSRVVWIVIAIDLALGVVLARLCHLPYALPVAIVLAAVPLALIALDRLRPRPGLRAPGAGAAHAHVLALLLWLIVAQQTTVAIDYYRFWGGNARRLGDPVTSERAYRRLVEIAPEEPTGHYQLGRLLLARGDAQAGVAALHVAQRLEPGRARAWIAEANHLAETGRAAEARAKAEAAVAAEPGHRGARDLLDRLTAGGAAPPTPATDDPDDAETAPR